MIAQIKSWFSKPKTAPKMQVVRVESQKITINQWRSQNSSVGASMELAQHPIYRAQRDILESQHPRRVLLPLGTTETDRLVHQARIEGYQWALMNMDLLSQPLKPKRDIEATFEPPEQER